MQTTATSYDDDDDEHTYNDDSKRDDFFDVDGDDFIMKFMDSTCQGFLSSNNNNESSAACLPACHNVLLEQQLEMFTVRVIVWACIVSCRLFVPRNENDAANPQWTLFLFYLLLIATALSTPTGFRVLVSRPVFRRTGG